MYSENIDTDLMNDTQREIARVCDEVKEKLLEKNRKYGNAVLQPKRIFSKADVAEQIKVRIDDKLSRVMSGQVDDDEDIDFDLAGYLIIKIVERNFKQKEETK